jgi:hypothetical protein
VDSASIRFVDLSAQLNSKQKATMKHSCQIDTEGKEITNRTFQIKDSIENMTSSKIGERFMSNSGLASSLPTKRPEAVNRINSFKHLGRATSYSTNEAPIRRRSSVSSNQVLDELRKTMKSAQMQSAIEPQRDMNVVRMVDMIDSAAYFFIVSTMNTTPGP